jgi:hypothetical protein
MEQGGPMKNLHDAVAEAVAEVTDDRLRVNRELGFDRGISVVCRLLQQLGQHQLAMEYVSNLMATPLGEKLASMTYEEREEIIRALDATKGKENP